MDPTSTTNAMTVTQVGVIVSGTPDAGRGTILTFTPASLSAHVSGFPFHPPRLSAATQATR